SYGTKNTRPASVVPASRPRITRYVSSRRKIFWRVISVPIVVTIDSWSCRLAGTRRNSAIHSALCMIGPRRLGTAPVREREGRPRPTVSLAHVRPPGASFPDQGGRFAAFPGLARPRQAVPPVLLQGLQGPVQRQRAVPAAGPVHDAEPLQLGQRVLDLEG